MQSTSTKWDYFIIHSQADSEVVSKLHDALVDAGKRVFWHRAGIQPTDDWVKKLRAAQTETNCFIVLITKNLPSAHFAQDEILIAIDLHRKEPDRHRVLPVIMDDVTLPPYGLAVFQWIDVRAIRGNLADVARVIVSPEAGGRLPTADPGESHPLHAFPRTGWVRSDLITTDLVDALSECVPLTERRLTVDKANAFRRQADPREEVPVIKHGAIAPYDVSQGVVYWSDVLHSARVNSPRMLAAVLLSVTTSAFSPRALYDLERLLAALRNPQPIR
jgi:hypothetical protein